MFSVTLLFALLQLLGFAISTADFRLVKNDGALPNVKRGESAKCRRANQGTWNAWSPVTTSASWTTVTVSTSKSAATSTISSTLTTTPIVTSTTTSSASATTSANPNCPTTFQLYIFGGSFGNFYITVNATGGYGNNKDRTLAARFTIQDGRLVTLTAPGGAAAVRKDTGPNGGILVSTLDAVNYDYVDAAFSQSCRLVLTKRVSATVTLDRIYSQDDTLYLASQNNPPPNGFDLTDFLSVDSSTT